MRKKTMLFMKKGVKAALAVALTASMAAPVAVGLTSVAADEGAAGNAEEAAIPSPIRTLDFNEGLKEYNKDQNVRLDVVKTEEILTYKTAEEKEETDKLDANGLLYMSGSETYYKKQTISNQPCTYYDEERGTVLYMGKTITLPAVMKTQSANIEGDAAATAALDKEIPVSTEPIQPEMTVSSELTIRNPFAGVTLSADDGKESTKYGEAEQPLWKEGLTLTYWIKAPTDEENKAIVGNILTWQPTSNSEYGAFQIDNDDSVLFTLDSEAADAQDGNQFYLNSSSADASAKSPASADNAGKWHQVAVTVQNDWVEFYMDGECVDVRANYPTLNSGAADIAGSFKAFNYGTGLRYGFGSEEGSAINRENAATLLTNWLCSDATTLHIGGSSAIASAFGLAPESAAIMLDDLTFYGQLLTAEQISAIYARDTAAMKAEPKATVINMASQVKDMEKDGKQPAASIEVKKDTVKGTQMDVVAVPENTSKRNFTGAELAVNPFAGKSLDGVTIAYWTKQDPRSSGKDTEKAETGTLAFIDTEKDIVHEKSDTNGKAYSIISVTSVGNVVYKEGFSNNTVGNSLKNTYVSSFSEADRAKFDVSDWYYVTLVMNNGGLTLYINGETYENASVDAKGKSIAAGVRFCDGYNQRKDDEADIHTKYNIFGGSNNQFATSVMEFLQREDTKIYLGYVPESGTANSRSNPTYYAGVRTFDKSLTADQVKTLYNNNAAFDDGSSNPGTPDNPNETPNPDNPNKTPNPDNPNETPKPGPSDIIPGDVNGDGSVKLDDANAALMAALAIGDPLTGDALKAADMDGDGNITLEDANKILRIALAID